MAAFFNNVQAQAPDVSNDRGCYVDNGYLNSDDCYGCGQEMPNNAGLCQAEGCPPCWTLTELYWDGDLGLQVYELVIDPDGVNIVKEVHTITQAVFPWGLRLHYIEI